MGWWSDRDKEEIHYVHFGGKGDSTSTSHIPIFYPVPFQASKPEHASIRVWSAVTWHQVALLTHHTLTVTQLAFSHSGSHLLAVSRDRGWSLWKHTNDGGTGVLYICVTPNRMFLYQKWKPFSTPPPPPPPPHAIPLSLSPPPPLPSPPLSPSLPPQYLPSPWWPASTSPHAHTLASSGHAAGRGMTPVLQPRLETRRWVNQTDLNVFSSSACPSLYIRLVPACAYGMPQLVHLRLPQFVLTACPSLYLRLAPIDVHSDVMYYL